MKTKLLLLPVAFFLLIQAPRIDAQTWSWQADNGSDQARFDGNTVSLALTKPGEVSATSANIPVTGGKPVAVTFKYTASGLNSAVTMQLSLHWLDASGRDVDAPRLPLGFPPLARVWEFSHNDKNPIDVADNLTVPDGATQARFTLRLTAEQGKGADRNTAAQVAASAFAFKDGEVKVTGIELPDSGPADAGPISQAPAGTSFPANLVPNGALEDGTDLPTGWKLEGDNQNSSAEWVTGGAYSGKRALKIYDRGPLINTWEKKPGDPFLPGGKATGNSAGAREEVSARWVSDAMPATPGTAYQTTAFYWYGSRVFLDQAVVNAVRIQFLDAKGNVLPPTTMWDDWFNDARAITETGWVFVPGKPLVAPPKTASVRVVVALHHAFATEGAAATPSLRMSEHRFVIVDNISLYALPANAAHSSNDEAYAAAAAAGALPYVGSSPAHRPNSVLVTSHTSKAAGLIVRPAGGDISNALSLEFTNLLGDARSLDLSYDFVDINGNAVGKGNSKVAVKAFAKTKAPIHLPASIPYGPYLLSYTLGEAGGSGSITGQARFGLMPPRQTSVAERGRMDYPFAFWMPGYTQTNFKGEREDILGQLADNGGMGKTWFGLSGMIYPDQFINIRDPAARQAAIDKRIAEARAGIAVWRKYGVTPMGGIQNTQLLDPSQYPILADVIKQFVTALKGDVHIWRHGTEAIHGGIKELDRATVEGHNGQGGDNTYLYWGRKGTVRQYWAEYLVAYKAAKEADPTCIFGPQSASDIEGDVLRTFFQVMPNTDLDSFGMNTYISAFSIWPPNERELQQNGVPNLPIYVSEFAAGGGATPTAPDHLEKEFAAAQRHVTYWASVLQSFPNLFHLEEWGMILGNDDGSMTYEGQIRPQYLSFATMTNQLGAGKFVAKYDLPGAEIYVRQRSVRKDYVALIWATGGDLPIDLDVSAHASVVDMWGNLVTISADHHVATVTASASPIYVTSATEIKPHMGVQISVNYATEDAAHPRIAVTLKNATTADAAGRIELVQNGPLRITDRVRQVASLAPGTSTTLNFDVQPMGMLDGQRITVQARYTVGEKTYQFPAALNFNTAAKAVSPPAIDADVSTWTDDELNEVADQANQVSLNGSPKPWGGPADISARTGARWDDKNLYLFFKVTDDIDMPPDNSPDGQWRRDGVELYIDPDRKLTSDAPFTMFGIARFPGGPKLGRFDGVLPHGDVPGSQVAAKRDGNLSLYEVAIPWDQIRPGFKPQAGEAISLAWTINDFDGGDSGRRQIYWFTREKDPSHFGDLILTGPAPTKP